MEICYIEAGVLERMLARAENLSARVDRLYHGFTERTRSKVIAYGTEKKT